MNGNAFTSGSPSVVIEDAGSSRGKRVFKMLLWIGVFFSFLGLFTVLKIPENQVREFVLNEVNRTIAPMGMSVSAREGTWGLIPTPSYSLSDVALTVATSSEPVIFDKMKVSPSLVALFKGKIGLSLLIKQADGTLDVDIHRSLSGAKADLSVATTNFNIGKLGVLAASPLSINASAILNGKADFSGEVNAPNTFMGQVGFKLTRFNVTSARILIEPSMNYGIELPKFNISECDIALSITAGKVQFQNFTLGKSAADDIRAKVSGDISLAPSLSASNLNLRTNLSFSPELMKAMTLFDTL